MNDKEKLLSFLYKAKEDYEASITISKQIFNKKRRYKALNTDLGLTNYFQRTFDFKNAVFVHLKSFKPIIEDENLINERYWYPIGCKEGFILRLNIINQALRLYQDINENNVAFILIDEEISLIEWVAGFDHQWLKDENENAIYTYINQNYEEYMEGTLDRG